MSFLQTTPEQSADGEVAVIYERDLECKGYLPNYSRTFSLHPDAYFGWRGLIEAIARPMDKRRYELATIGAARQLKSSYCSLAHGKILTDQFFEPELGRWRAYRPGQSDPPLWLPPPVRTRTRVDHRARR